MKKIALLLVAVMLLSLFGCKTSAGNPTDSSTTTAPTTQPTTTVPTTSVIYPTAPDKDPNEYEYKPADIPQEYWAVLNNEQAIYFYDGVDLKNGDTSVNVAYLDDIRTRTMSHDLAAYSCSYHVTDVDNDGNDDLLLLSLDVFLLSEKDGIVYGQNYPALTYFYSDGTMYYSTQAGAVEVACNTIYLGAGKWVSPEKWRIDRTDDCNIKYYIGKTEVTADEFQFFFDSQNYREIEWKDMTRYPLYAPELDETPPGG